jgi:putative hydrolase of the HAD superfamily
MIRPLNASVTEEICSYRGLLVDIDDTLYSYEQAHLHGLALIYQKLRTLLNDIDEEDFGILYRKHRNRVAKFHAGGSVTRSRFLALNTLLEEQGVAEPYVHALMAENCYWQGLIASMVPYDNIINLLRRAKFKGSKICIVTDMQSVIQVKKLQKLNLTSVVDLIVTSEEIGIEKPDPKIFLAALEKISLNRTECIMLGDNIEKDIQGANKIGIDACLTQKNSFLEISYRSF